MRNSALFIAFLLVSGNALASGFGLQRPVPATFSAPGEVVMRGEFTHFSVHRVNGAVQLQWTTVAETNCSHFVIERSLDGETWMTVGLMAGAGTSNQSVDYLDLDYNPPASVLYYRLQQVSYDGSYFLSPRAVVPALQLDWAPSKSIETIANTVATGQQIQVHFVGITEFKMLLVLRDAAGHEYFAKVVQLDGANSYEVVDVSHEIPAGIYLITAASTQQVYGTTLTVNKG